MHTIIQFYSPPDVDDRVDREEKRNNQTYRIAGYFRLDLIFDQRLLIEN